MLFLFLKGCAIGNDNILIHENVIMPVVDGNTEEHSEENIMAESNGEFIDDNTDYNQYLKYIWIADWNENNTPLSFRIDKIDGNIISGGISTNIAEPEYFRDLDEYLEYSGNNMYGEIVNGVAECVFNIHELMKGTIRIELIGANALRAEIKYIEKNEIVEYYRDGTSIYRPYNITDRDLFIEDKNLEIETNLDSWGDVKIVSGRQETSHAVPVIFMTDKEGNVFYSFSAPFQHETSVKEVIVEDMNGDGLQDVKIVTWIITDEPDNLEDFIWNFYQMKNGLFLMERSGYIP